MTWEDMWASGLGKGDKFDAAVVEPALRDLIDSGALPPSGPALVPGCGRGYAVAALAESGQREVLGIDIAPTAVKAAQEWQCWSYLPFLVNYFNFSLIMKLG